jgi:hypothetical protein
LIGFCFEQFADGLLVKPSTAESLIDLQAEFNALSISAVKDHEEMTLAIEVNAGWNLQKYYN